MVVTLGQEGSDWMREKTGYTLGDISKTVFLCLNVSPVTTFHCEKSLS